jgi:CBS domain-containing protein
MDQPGRRLDQEYASPDWTLQQAASTMVRAGFRHLVVVEGNELTGAAVHARHRALLGRRRRPGPG